MDPICIVQKTFGWEIKVSEVEDKWAVAKERQTEQGQRGQGAKDKWSEAKDKRGRGRR
ncbi:hypothetical protein [Runella zeae]|uniref:hypothetical protein n=1 Tax=Runella zeae TaxID=94255 RepID=UPI00040871D1|nr:hypothetical protein [Runella zeae]